MKVFWTVKVPQLAWNYVSRELLGLSGWTLGAELDFERNFMVHGSFKSESSGASSYSCPHLGSELAGWSIDPFQVGVCDPGLALAHTGIGLE